jgi:hypothetical protein
MRVVRLVALFAVIAACGALGQYDPTTAMSALQYCKTAYCPANEIQAWNCGPACQAHSGFQVVGVYNNASIESQAYTGYDSASGTIVVAIRGSSNIENWINDLDFFKTQYTNPACGSSSAQLRAEDGSWSGSSSGGGGSSSGGSWSGSSSGGGGSSSGGSWSGSSSGGGGSSGSASSGSGSAPSSGSGSGSASSGSGSAPSSGSGSGSASSGSGSAPSSGSGSGSGPGTGCEVHRGFLQEWQSLSSGVLSDVQSMVSQYGAPVFVTGHSLGAAVSILAAMDIITSITADVTVYNFGEPRVGNPMFAAWAASQLQAGMQFRVTHQRDPVPHVPPEDFGFLHCPHELWYDNDGDTQYSNCNDSPTAEDPACSDSVIPFGIDDHLLYLGICTECTCSSELLIKKYGPAVANRVLARMNKNRASKN